MTYTFDFTEQDALHFALFRIRGSPLFQWANRIAFTLLLTVPLLPVLLCLRDILSEAQWETDAVIIETILTTVFCAVLYRIHCHRSERRAVREVLRSMEWMRAAHAFGVRTVVFKELRIVERNGHMERTTSYRDIVDIRQSDHAVCLFTAPTEAVVLPLRIFASQEEKERLLALVQGEMLQQKRLA